MVSQSEHIRSNGRIITVTNPHAEIILHQANERKHSGDLTKALEIYDQVLMIDPGNARAYHSKGNVMDMLGRYKEAVACYDMALEHDPLHAEAWYNKGITLSKMGCENDGNECIQRGISLAIGSH